ncbi:MAG: DUF6350 family protein [Micrococcaceae bacterium]
MPIWLQAVMETAQNGIYLYLIITIPLILGSSFSNMSSWNDIGSLEFRKPLRLGGSLWLFAHGASLQLTDFRYTLLPLAFLAIPVYMNYRSGKKLMAAAEKGQIVVAWFAGIVTYILFAFIMYFLSAKSFIKTNDVQAIGFSTLVVISSLVIGSFVAAGRFENLFGLKTGTELSVTRRYIHTVLGSTTVLLITALFVSGLFFTISLIFNWAQATVVYEAAELGLTGVFAMFFAQLFYLPNFLMWTFSWLANTGFSIGQSTHLSVTDHTINSIPLVPVSAAIPGPVGWFSLFFLFIVLLCPILAGWWFWRTIPLEIDKELGHQIDNPFIRNAISAVASALSVGILSGLILTFLAWLSSGSIGAHQLSFVGIAPLDFAWRISIMMAAGVFIGHFIAPWLDNFALPKLQQESQLLKNRFNKPQAKVSTKVTKQPLPAPSQQQLMQQRNRAQQQTAAVQQQKGTVTRQGPAVQQQNTVVRQRPNLQKSRRALQQKRKVTAQPIKTSIPRKPTIPPSQPSSPTSATVELNPKDTHTEILDRLGPQ